MLPNFVVVGAPKAGTTSLYNYLKGHPDVFLPHRKELLFFDSSFHKGLPWYERYFKHYRGEKAAGDISPTYMSNPFVPKRMRRTIPDAKIVFILRDPVERAYSHYWDLVGWGSSASFKETLRAPTMYKRGHGYIEFDILDFGLYSLHIKRFLDHFPAEQCGFFLYDDLRDRPQEFLNGILRFIGVSERPLPLTERKFHTCRVNRSRLFGNVLVSERLRDLTYSCVPSALVPACRGLYESLLSLNTKKIKPPAMGEEEKSFLKERYRGEILSLQDLIRKDLSSWLQR